MKSKTADVDKTAIDEITVSANMFIKIIMAKSRRTRDEVASLKFEMYREMTLNSIVI